MIERILHETGRNKSKAARSLGLTRTQLYGRLRRYGVSTDRRRTSRRIKSKSSNRLLQRAVRWYLRV